MMACELSQSLAPCRILNECADDCVLFDGQAYLYREGLIQAVLSRNPSIESARQAWEAAVYRYPQVIALDDPMMAYAFAPESIG